MRYAYYPGCSLHSTGLEYDMSSKVISKHFGIDLWEIPDWNCCGATAAHTTNHLLSLALPARNLAIAEREGLDVVAPCAACYNRLKSTEVALKDAAIRAEVSEVIETDVQGTSRVRPLLDILVNDVGLETIEKQVLRPLAGLKVASYYGCLLTRPPKVTEFDDPENPQSMDRLITALGGTAVNWPAKTECCGASLSASRTDVQLAMTNEVLRWAKAAGADCVVTACPLCTVNLDMRQDNVESTFGVSYKLPVYYFTELTGIALGYGPKELGLDKHFVGGIDLLQSKDLLRHPATRREEA